MVFLLVDALVELLASLAPPTPPQVLVLLTALLAMSLFALPLLLTTSLLACILLAILLATVPLLLITSLTPSVFLLVSLVMLSVLATPADSLVVFAPRVIARLVAAGLPCPLALVSRIRLATDTLGTPAQLR